MGLPTPGHFAITPQWFELCQKSKCRQASTRHGVCLNCLFSNCLLDFPTDQRGLQRGRNVITVRLWLTLPPDPPFEKLLNDALRPDVKQITNWISQH